MSERQHEPGGSQDGCLNTLALGGRVRSTGTKHLTNDTLVLRGSQMPNSAALHFQGVSRVNLGAGAVFGDGLACAGGSVRRLDTKTNSSSASSYPGAGDPPVSVQGAVTAPRTEHYQAWYRNAASFCTASTFNLANGWSATWRL